MFAMVFAISCSGEDGKDGVDGIDGINGEDGKNTDCISSLNTTGSYDIICDNEKIGEISNGTDGTGCDIIDSSAYTLMKCDSSITIAKWAKAMCGPNAYDPEKYVCDDRDGKIYKYVKIDDQIWMAENLNYASDSSICSNVECRYGRLYSLSMAANACLVGWHLSSDEEWAKLAIFVGSDEGMKLRSIDGWSNKGTDDYGFSVLPGGYGYYSDSLHYQGQGIFGYWWSPTSFETDTSFSRCIDYERTDVSRGLRSNSDMLSVRCVRN
jgi:uncharacterized protein (TIGR02145 family)